MVYSYIRKIRGAFDAAQRFQLNNRNNNIYKVLLVTENLLEGGMQLFLLRLALGLMKQGVPVAILLLNSELEKLEITRQFPEVVILRRINKTNGLQNKLDRLLFSLRSDFSLLDLSYKKWIRKQIKPGCIIHTQYIKTDYLIATINKTNPNFHHVVTVHGDYSAQYYHYNKYRRGVWNWMESKLQTLKRQVDKWVVISEEQKLFFQKEIQAPKDSIIKIYNGFNAHHQALPDHLLSSRQNGQFVIGMVARGVEEKGWAVLLKAFAALPENARLIMVGEGPFLQKLQAENKNERIVFTGFHPNPLEVIRSFDVFVLPTLFPFESLPTVIIEALFCGVPVIATKVGEIEAMITDPSTGIKAGFTIPYDGVSYDDSILTEKLLLLMKDEIVRKEMSKAAVRAFAKFDMETCVKAYMEVYASLGKKEFS